MRSTFRCKGMRKGISNKEMNDDHYDDIHGDEVANIGE